MDVVFTYCPRIVAMHQGAILADGTPDEIRNNEQVTANMLGGTVTAMLEVQRLNTFRGPAHVLRDLALRVGDAESVCLVGRNGAGKTTTIDSIMGLLPIKSGTVTLNGRDITRLPAHERAWSGIGYSPEDAGIFPDLTVAENFQIGRSLAKGAAAGRREGIDQRVFALFPEVRDFTSRRGLFLSGGQKKMVAIARALTLSSVHPAPRRALRGARPGDRQPLHRGGQAHQGHGRLAPHRGVESHDRLAGRRPALRHRPGRDHL